MCISMATRSVHEHPGRFLVAILKGLIDKLLNEKTTVAMQACWGDQEGLGQMTSSVVPSNLIHSEDCEYLTMS